MKQMSLFPPDSNENEVNLLEEARKEALYYKYLDLFYEFVCSYGYSKVINDLDELRHADNKSRCKGS